MMNRKHAALLVIFWAGIASAQITETKLIASDGVFYDNFGASVSISSDYALVGAPADDNGNGAQAGAAYIFHYDGSNWVEQAKLIAGDGAADDVFGVSVSLSGDYALVGALGDDDNGVDAGSAYIFHYNGSNWIQQAKLIANDGSAVDYFGVSVSLSGDYALIGAQYDSNVNGGSAGAAYIFHYDGTNWAEQTKLIPSDGDVFEVFGRSVSLSGDYALVGSPYDDDNGPTAGSAYIFHYDGSNWVEQAKLIGSDGAITAYFGWTVSLSGDRALVGALYESNVNGGGAGSAYIFHNDGSNWVEQTKLLASDGESYDWFGSSVSISGDYALVGVYGDDDNGDDGGSAYIFQYDGSTWLEQTKLMASHGRAYDQFGSSVSLSGDYALVGAFGDDDNGESAGSAYAYTGFAIVTPGSIPCDSIDSFQARCVSGGSIQARIVLLNSTQYAGEEVIISIDAVNYPLTVITNGTHSKAQTQLTGQALGDHDIALVNPAGCFLPLAVTCATGFAKADEEWIWDEDKGETQALSGEIPRATTLFDNYPDPFNPSTTIRYALSVDAHVTLGVYNMLGQLVATLVDEFQSAGYQQAVWNGSNEFGQRIASGIYIYRMTTGTFTETKRMLLLK